MAIRQLEADDWALYRDLRLAALSTDPGAFASTLERESAFDESRWRERLSVGPDGRPIGSFVDETDDRHVRGLTQVVFTPHSDAPMLVAMWVRPEDRGSGSGQRLVDAAASWARDRGESAMVLWVVEDNHDAVALYERCGFTPTGATDVLPSNPDAVEIEMIIDLT